MGTQRRPVVHAAWQAEGEVDGVDGVRLPTLTGTNELGRSSRTLLLPGSRHCHQRARHPRLADLLNCPLIWYAHDAMLLRKLEQVVFGLGLHDMPALDPIACAQDSLDAWDVQVVKARHTPRQSQSEL